MTGNIQNAKGQRTRLVARASKPVTGRRPLSKVKKRFKPLDDPLLRADEYSYDGPTGLTAHEDIDGAVYGL